MMAINVGDFGYLEKGSIRHGHWVEPLRLGRALSEPPRHTDPDHAIGNDVAQWLLGRTTSPVKASNRRRPIKSFRRPFPEVSRMPRFLSTARYKGQRSLTDGNVVSLLSGPGQDETPL